MIPVDTHAHSIHSPDATDSIDALCEAAIKKGIRYLCLTEHYDAFFDRDGTPSIDLEAYSVDIMRSRKKYSGSLTLLQGLEFGEPHIYKKELDHINQLEIDMVMGSVHALEGVFLNDPQITEKYRQDEIYELYFTEINKTVNHGGFDVLGHIDLPARYSDTYYSITPTLEKLISDTISQEIVIEINTSPLRRGFDYSLPDRELLSVYKDNGGEYICCGSDAHHASHIGEGSGYIEELIRYYKFIPVYFEKRKLRQVTL